MYTNFLQEMSNIGRARYREVSSSGQCELHEMSATWRFCYESLTVISCVPEKRARCRELSAIKDVRYKVVSLYSLKG